MSQEPPESCWEGARVRSWRRATAAEAAMEREGRAWCSKLSKEKTVQRGAASDTVGPCRPQREFAYHFTWEAN